MQQKSPETTRTEPKLDQHEQDIRYIEGRQIERGLLSCLQDLLEDLGGQNPDKAIKNSGYTLETNLKGKFNSWQFFENGSPGLNSGGCAEAFNRLLATDIMVEMPELCDLPKNTTDYGVKILGPLPVDSGSKVVIEVITDVGDDMNIRGCRFKFETSLDRVNQRFETVGKEIEDKRREIRENHD